MLPHFNSHLQKKPNFQSQNNGNSGPPPQQVIGNPGSFCPNPMQIQPQFQMGILNPQLAMPQFNNPNTCFAPNPMFPFPQGGNNLPQFFNPNNAVNPAQFLANGQFNVPNLMQSVNQLMQMQMQMPNFNPQNFANGGFGMVNGNGISQQPVNGNRISQPVNCNGVLQQSMNGNGISQQFMNGNGISQQSMNGNVSNQMNPKATGAKDFSTPQQQNQSVFSPGAAKLQNHAGEVNGVNNNWRKPNQKNFTGNPKRDASQRGFAKNQFHLKQNGKGNFNSRNENLGKGYRNFGAQNATFSGSGKQIEEGKKRPLVLNYTEKEIQQWREQRRKNHPSNANKEKNSKENPTQPEATDDVAKNIRQQLKEILEKQAELGCEVAEIPSSYLSDSEQPGKKQNAFGNRGRFQNKFDKRGKFNKKFNQNDRFSKRQKPQNDSENPNNRNGNFNKKQKLGNDSSNNQRNCKKKDPSLLQKLLSSDIKRDKKHLLQVFRFMAMNSFFQNSPEKGLKYPLVIVKEPGEVGADVVGEAACSRANVVTQSEEGEIID